MYYVYRYMLDAVNDYDVLLKAKNAVIGILAVDIMAAANHASGCTPDFTMRVDIAHLYSRQLNIHITIMKFIENILALRDAIRMSFLWML